MVESVKHFLLICPKYVHEQHHLRHQLCHNADSLQFLLSNPAALKPLLKYVNSTGRFHSTFSNLECKPWCVNAILCTPSHLVTTRSAATLLLLPYLVVAPFWAALFLLHHLNGLCCFLIQYLTLSLCSLSQGGSGEQIWHGLGCPGQSSCHLEWVMGKLDLSGSRSCTSAGWDWFIPDLTLPYFPVGCHV
jgi:hypothetical protein